MPCHTVDDVEVGEERIEVQIITRHQSVLGHGGNIVVMYNLLERITPPIVGVRDRTYALPQHLPRVL